MRLRNRLEDWMNESERRSADCRPERRFFGIESLETRVVLSNDVANVAILPELEDPAPFSAAEVQYLDAAQQAAQQADPAQSDTKRVLLVIPSVHFWYNDYEATRASLEEAGIEVQVAAPTLDYAVPHANSGQGPDGGVVQPDLRIDEVAAADFDAVAFLGGWGATSLQYTYEGTYFQESYNGDAATKLAVNNLVNDFHAQDKHIAAICVGVGTLAYTDVGGESLLAGRTVSAYAGYAPPSPTHGYRLLRSDIEGNGAVMVNSHSIGDPTTASDDVFIDGKIITAENSSSASHFGAVIAQEIFAVDTANVVPDEAIPQPPVEPEGPVEAIPEAPAEDAGETQQIEPVLLVIANQDFYYQEYNDTRAALEAQGLSVVVAAPTLGPATPHANSGQGAGDGVVLPDIALTDADAADYSAISVIGGWGASQFYYAYEGEFANPAYNGTEELQATFNDLVNDFITQDKYVTAICHGVSALMQTQNGVGEFNFEGTTVAGYAGNAPYSTTDGNQLSRFYVEQTGATMVASQSIGDPGTADDDVTQDGKLITAENFDSAYYFGTYIAEQLLSDAMYPDDDPEEEPPVEEPPAEGGGEVEAVQPVLMVIANQDFYYQEYFDTRQSLEAAGLEVVVAAATTETATPHLNSGQGAGSGEVMPDIALTDVNAGDYSAVAIVGGWGSSQYAYGFDTEFTNPAYNGTEQLRETFNDLLNDFDAQGKYIAAICHGVMSVGYAQTPEGTSLLDGVTVSTYSGNAPTTVAYGDQLTSWYLEQEGAIVVPSNSVGDPAHAHDDVIVDGNRITAQNWDSAALFGEVIANQLLGLEGDPGEEEPPVEEPPAEGGGEVEAVQPVLLVIANQDFYYQEYFDTRQSLEAAGLEVVVAAATTETATPHLNSGQGAGSGEVMPDIALTDVNAGDYSAVAIVGGWGATQYYYAYEGDFANPNYNGTDEVKEAFNAMVDDFVDQGKYVAAICHGVSALAQTTNELGDYQLEGQTVAGFAGTAPNSLLDGNQLSRFYVEQSGATMVESQSVGDLAHAFDDVIVSNLFITAENWDSAALFGEVIANQLLGLGGDPGEEEVPPEDPGEGGEVEGVQPVLLIISDVDFYYQEYADTRASLEAAGLTVVVAAPTLGPATPHANSGQGAGDGIVLPDITIADAIASDYSAVAVSGGWGTTQFYYTYEGVFANPNYNGTDELQDDFNELIGDFVEQGKTVAAISHAVSALAQTQDDMGIYHLDGVSVSSYAGYAPESLTDGAQLTRWYVEQTGAIMVESQSIGNPGHSFDDVLVSGQYVTAEDWDSASYFGEVVAQQILGA
ncbi:DJ-1/PfpI family protein [Kolteria novifilia]